MTKLKDKVQHALYEARILVLGAQVFIGFQYHSAFEKGFEGLPVSSQYLMMGALGLMMVTLALLVAPGAYHRIVEEGEDTQSLHRFTTRVMSLALLPFALSLGINLYVVSEELTGRILGAAFGLAATAVALFFWYGLKMSGNAKSASQAQWGRGDEEEQSGAKLSDRVLHVLTEIRVTLPGTSALLGFQFVIVLGESFERLPASSKYVHLASLALIILAVAVLIAPVAYHRLVEEGEDTERFHRFASRMMLAALVPMALGVCGDLYVAVRKVTESFAQSLTAAALALLLFYGLWFGFTLYRKNQTANRRAALA